VSGVRRGQGVLREGVNPPRSSEEVMLGASPLLGRVEVSENLNRMSFRAEEAARGWVRRNRLQKELL